MRYLTFYPVSAWAVTKTLGAAGVRVGWRAYWSLYGRGHLVLFWLAPDQAALQEVLPLRDLLARHGAPASLLDEVGRLLPPHDRMAVQGRDDLSNLPPR